MLATPSFFWEVISCLIMFRIFVEKNDIGDNRLLLNSNTSHYLNRVIKVRKGDNLEVVITGQILLEVCIEAINQKELMFTIIKEEKIEPKNKLRIILAQCLPKQDKMTDIFKKCTEVGVGEIYPILSERVITKLDAKTGQKKLDRWAAAVISAASQSKQTKVPFIHSIRGIQDMAKTEKENALKLIFWEEEKDHSLKAVLRNHSEKIDSIIAVIGPEGGLSKKEVDDLKQAGFISVSLGTSILRVENAGLVAISNILYELMPA
jgi:16S rRNA (uracil1498-N3)-methyltransferase